MDQGGSRVFWGQIPVYAYIRENWDLPRVFLMAGSCALWEARWIPLKPVVPAHEFVQQVPRVIQALVIVDQGVPFQMDDPD